MSVPHDQYPHWSQIPMIDEATIDARLGSRDELSALAYCLTTVHRDFVRILEVSERLQLPNNAERPELLVQLAHRVEHAWRWQERLEELLQPISHEFGGASVAKPPRIARISGESAVVVATKLGQGILGSFAALVEGRHPPPLKVLCSESPPLVRRERALEHAEAIAAWALKSLSAIAIHSLAEHIGIELGFVRRARKGIPSKKQRRWHVVDARGRLNKIGAGFIRSVAWHNKNNVLDPGYKWFATKAGKSHECARHYLPSLVRGGFLARDKAFGLVVTSKGHSAIAEYEGRNPNQ